MEFSNDVVSTYHRVLGAYVRDSNGELVRCVGQCCGWVQSVWPMIQAKAVSSSTKSVGLSTLPVTADLPVHDEELGVEMVEIHERQSAERNQFVGLILKKTKSTVSLTGPTFEKFFPKLLLDQMWLGAQTPMRSASKKDDLTHAIVDLFDTRLRYHVPNDQWNLKGREYFTSKVQYFMSRNLRVELCLPAFPCKSSNPEKVAGTLPDKGEEMALRTLHEFVRQVEEIYEPGARIWIISDGHVFSDCIGVDDSTVDRYGDKLKELNEAIGSAVGSTGRVCFRSLVDLFNLEGHGISQSSLAKTLGIPNINHHITTALTDDAELCRRILMAGCQTDPAGLRARIDSQDASILALYRGFSRFMLEDLDLHPLTQPLTRSKRKKLAAMVSFEMIRRNQAYSNLVEVIFPDHIRLSIHAHDNAGPKFGIQLFDRSKARATSTLSGDAMSSSDLLHIPTPWHNCVAEVAGCSKVHIVKSLVVQEALSAHEYAGIWTEGDLSQGQGGHFSLWRAGSESWTVRTKRLAESPVLKTMALTESIGQQLSGRKTFFKVLRKLYDLAADYLKLCVLKCKSWGDSQERMSSSL